MKRLSVHAAFAAVALACVAVAGYDGARLATARRIDDQVTALLMPAAGEGGTAVSPVSAKAPDGAAEPGSELASGRDLPREIQLAQAIALSAAGQYSVAGRRFEALVENGALDETGRAALLDLGNMYLREGAGEKVSAVRSLPMIEQAKARYRALLRVAPDDWDARYNLELALRLAPETQENADASNAVTKHGVKLRGAQSEDLP